eukprot:577340-Pleurochrysis_carterae.AAC.1
MLSSYKLELKQAPTKSCAFAQNKLYASTGKESSACDGVQSSPALSLAASQAQHLHVRRRPCRRLAAVALRSFSKRLGEGAGSARTVHLRPRVHRSPQHPHRP